MPPSSRPEESLIKHPRDLKKSRWSSPGIFILVTLIWAVLYLPHLRTSPPWYTDESNIHETAMDLVHGKMTLRGLAGAFWHPYNPYQPFYHLVVGLSGLATHGDILGSRYLNVRLAWACALATYFFGRLSLGRNPSLSACLMFLTYDHLSGGKKIDVSLHPTKGLEIIIGKTSGLRGVEDLKSFLFERR